jgi:transposase
MDECSYEARKTAPKDRIEVTMRPEPRRRWSSEDKLRIVRETLRPGAVASVVADQHGIGTGLLYTWRRQMLTAAMTGFAAVEVTPEPQAPPLLDGPSFPHVPAQAPDHGCAAMDAAAEIDLPDGTRVRVRSYSKMRISVSRSRAALPSLACSRLTSASCHGPIRGSGCSSRS